MNYFLVLSSCNGDLGNCCSDPGIVLALNAFRKITSFVQMLVPIVLIVCTVIAFFRLVVNPEEKKGLKKIENIFIAAFVVFFIPMIIDIALSVLPSNFKLSSCWNDAKSYAEFYTSSNNEYVPLNSNRSTVSIIGNPDDYQKGVPVEDAELDGSSASGILAGAEEVHTMYEQNGWAYYYDLGQLKWGDIRYSTNNPSKMTCCATFVGSALYVGGVFTEDEINSYNYNHQGGISDLCQAHGWTKITSYSDLVAGDIVIMSAPGGGSTPGHVQIYAGNGTWYNAGYTEAIQRDNPYASDASGNFLYAWRIPS